MPVKPPPVYRPKNIALQGKFQAPQAYRAGTSPHQAQGPISRAAINQRAVAPPYRPERLPMPASASRTQLGQEGISGKQVRVAQPYRPTSPVRNIANESPIATVQLKSTIQRIQCGECMQHNRHLKSCSKYIPPKVSHSGKRTHVSGMNHDDGSGFTHRGAGSDRHDHGLHVQAVIRRRKERDKKK